MVLAALSPAGVQAGVDLRHFVGGRRSAVWWLLVSRTSTAVVTSEFEDLMCGLGQERGGFSRRGLGTSCIATTSARSPASQLGRREEGALTATLHRVDGTNDSPNLGARTIEPTRRQSHSDSSASWRSYAPNERIHPDWLPCPSTTVGHGLASPTNIALDDTDVSVRRLL